MLLFCDTHFPSCVMFLYSVSVVELFCEKVQGTLVYFSTVMPMVLHLRTGSPMTSAWCRDGFPSQSDWWIFKSCLFLLVFKVRFAIVSKGISGFGRVINVA